MVLHTRGSSRSPPFYNKPRDSKETRGFVAFRRGEGKVSEQREGMMRQRGERTSSSFSQVCDFYGVVEKMRIKGERLDEKCNFAP